MLVKRWENRFMLNVVLRNFKARCIRAGIKTDLKLNLHGLRKSWATNLANSGKVPMHTLQMLGRLTFRPQDCRGGIDPQTTLCTSH